MNFLGHYFFDHIPGQHAYNTGLVMPDLVKIFTGQRLPFTAIRHLGDTNLLAAGSLQHIRRDAHFHNSAYFRDTAAFTLDVFKKNGVYNAIPRSWFLAHITNELVLDRVLQKKDEDLASAFYTGFDLVSEEDMTHFLQSAGIADTPLFLQRLNRFKEVRYLPAYLHNEKLIYSLNRIYFQAGMREAWTPEQNGLLDQTLATIETNIMNEFQKLVAEMEQINND